MWCRANRNLERSVEWAYARPPCRPNPQTGVETFPFEIAAKRLEIDENVEKHVQ